MLTAYSMNSSGIYDRCLTLLGAHSQNDEHNHTAATSTNLQQELVPVTIRVSFDVALQQGCSTHAAADPAAQQER
jgi:hypothetical protein